MEPLTAQGIRTGFVNLSKGKAKDVDLPELAAAPWPDLDYLGWRDGRNPARAYLSTWRDGAPVSVALRAPSSGGRSRATALCALCHSVHRPGEVLLYVAPRAGSAGRDANTVGTYVCADLACSLYVRGLRPLEVAQGTSLEPRERAVQLVERLDAFLDRVM